METGHKISTKCLMTNFYAVSSFCTPTCFDYLPWPTSESYNFIQTEAPYRLTFQQTAKIYIH